MRSAEEEWDWGVFRLGIVWPTLTKSQTMRQLGTSGSNGRCLTARGIGTSHLLERWILAQLSRRETVRLKTRLPSEESSESTQK